MIIRIKWLISQINKTPGNFEYIGFLEKLNLNLRGSLR